jgi:hypothetical protein
MAESISDALSEAPKKFDHRKNLKPFPKGVSGCPGGRVQSGMRYQTLYGQLKAELGELNAVEAALLDRAVVLLLRKPRNDGDAVKVTSEARRILEKLGAGHAKVKASATPPLRERIAEQA